MKEIPRKYRKEIKRHAKWQRELKIGMQFDGSVETASIQPGDILVFSTSMYLTKEQAEELGVRARERFPDHQCAILSAGLSLNIIRPERPPAAEAPL